MLCRDVELMLAGVNSVRCLGVCALTDGEPGVRTKGTRENDRHFRRRCSTSRKTCRSFCPRKDSKGVALNSSIAKVEFCDSKLSKILVVGMENAVDALEAHFRKAHSTLSFVQHKLELEFSETYEDYVNPMQLLSRIKKLQEELPAIRNQVADLLTAKQEVSDTLREGLVSNRTLLRGLQARAGLASESDSGDAVFSSFSDILREWDAHFGKLQEIHGVYRSS